MEKIALVTDSTSDLSEEIIKKYDIKVLRLKVIYKDKDYIDGVTITSDEVYDNLVNEIPTTSTPLVGDAEKLIKTLEDEGYTHVIAIHISSELSGTLNMVNLVLEKSKLKTFVFDSKALSMGCGQLVLGCAEMIEKGKTFNQITEQLPAMRDKITVYFVVDTLKYLIKGGRIGKVSGVVGSIIQLKPIISIGKDGIYYTFERIRGKKQAVKRMIELAEESLLKNKARVWVMQGGALEEGKAFLEKIKAFPNITEINFGSIGPVLGVHTGPGLMALALIQEPFYT